MGFFVQCGSCGDTISVISVKECFPDEEGKLINTCHGCSFLSAKQRASPKGPWLGRILRRWRPEWDISAAKFAFQPNHSVQFVMLLEHFSQFYYWKNVAIMVNSIAMERIRHGKDKSRHVTIRDFITLYELCQGLGFARIVPENISTITLAKMNLAVDETGLIQQGVYPFFWAEYMGVCADGGQCGNMLPARHPIIFTEAYRSRQGCHLIA
ncbi:uncharacterized protein F4822DRAFT_239924 [Hypoxylon trugodes]|uniref:uncharacterized protein n=1 Tax=Hypoxylon trugodes TaxID=326681 RepID=UPI00219E5253|nr:uncharacterized protein F4822DRAFT_239924 [Hypoxylon trugodes]KAI1388259.1 hypothetical protein F4822DRAFT_239924 [Hypoxylon trugodes]